MRKNRIIYIHLLKKKNGVPIKWLILNFTYEIVEYLQRDQKERGKGQGKM